MQYNLMYEIMKCYELDCTTPKTQSKDWKEN